MTIGRSGERTVHTLVIDGVTHAVAKEATPALFTIKKNGLVYFEGNNPITAIRDITEEEYNILPHCMACAGVMCEADEYRAGAVPPLCKGCAKPDPGATTKPPEPLVQPPAAALTTEPDSTKTSQKPVIKDDPLKDYKPCKYCPQPLIWVQEKSADQKTTTNVPYEVYVDEHGDVKRGKVHDCRKNGDSNWNSIHIVRQNVLAMATEIVLHGAKSDDKSVDDLVGLILPLAERLERWVLHKEEVTV